MDTNKSKENMKLQERIIREELIRESLLSTVWKAFLGAFIAQKALEYGSTAKAKDAAEKAYNDAMNTPKLKDAIKRVQTAEDELNSLVDTLEKKYNIKFSKNVRMTK